MRQILSKVQRIRAIAGFEKKFEANLAKADSLTNRIYTAFENPKSQFTAEQVKGICANLEKVANTLAGSLKTSFVNLKTAVQSNVPTTRVVAHIEDAHTLLSKIAILKSQAIASISAEEDIQMDDSGQLVDEAPVEDAEDETPEEEKTPEELAADIHEDLDLLVQELSGETPEDETNEACAKQAKKSEKAEGNPDMPKSNKENPPMREVKDSIKLSDEYEKEPTEKNAKKKAVDVKTANQAVTQKAPPKEKPLFDASVEAGAEAELNPDMPKSNKENPPAEEESLEELVDEFEKSPSDPENLEMDDSMIDDAVNSEILSEGDSDVLENEVVKSSASLRDRKLAASRKTASQTPVTEDDVMSEIIASSF